MIFCDKYSLLGDGFILSKAGNERFAACKCYTCIYACTLWLQPERKKSEFTVVSLCAEHVSKYRRGSLCKCDETRLQLKLLSPIRMFSNRQTLPSTQWHTCNFLLCFTKTAFIEAWKYCKVAALWLVYISSCRLVTGKKTGSDVQRMFTS